MSLFSWFKPKAAPVTAPFKPARTVPAALQATSSRPVSVNSVPPSVPKSGSIGPLDQHTARKAERIARREKLYAVVRDAMARAGVLSASYKFKVLSLDAGGKQYLIMMDLSNRAAGDTGRLAEIESLIAQNAKAQHEILVSAVYWRVNEYVTAGLTAHRQAAAAAQTAPAVAPAVAAIAGASTAPILVATSATAGGNPRFEPIQPDEVAAFKNAIGANGLGKPLAGSGEIIRSGPRNADPDFENTELQEGDERISPLSTSQYGELN